MRNTSYHEVSDLSIVFFKRWPISVPAERKAADPAAPTQTKRPPAIYSPGAAFALSFLFRKSAQDLSDVPVDADRLPGDLRRAGRLPAVDAGIDGVLVFGRHLPKGIFDLLSRPWRFNELKKDLEGISQKVLTDSLRSMEADGIIARTVYAEVPPRVEYSLTPLGRSLKPILDSMVVWGEGYKKQYAKEG